MDNYYDLYVDHQVTDGFDIRESVLERLRAPRRISVVESCKQFMRVSTPGGYDGPWSGDITPYMIEPMNAMISRQHEAVVFVGVAQSGKTASLAEGLLTYSIVVDPSDCTLVMPSKDSARDFSKRRLERLIRNSPEIGKRICTGEEDNLLDKMTLSGAMLTIGWPTVSQLASKNLKRVILSDLDRMPLDIGGEGDAFSLARKRTQSFMSAGMVVAESTPGWDIVDREWKEPDPDDHSGPPVSGGVVPLFNQGTRERFYWTCPHCEDKFRAEMQYFRWDELDDPIKASETAHMVCPHCGVIITEDHKPALNATGEWLPEGWRTGTPKTSKIRSFWMHGIAAAFQRWQSLAYNMIVARREYLETGAVERLKTVTNVDWGLPFLSPATTAKRESTELASLAEGYPLRTVPENARFLIASIDLQKNRFVLQVVAHGPKRERWVIDRMNLTESLRVQGDGSFARVEPFNYAEDFEILLKILTDKKYPHATQGEMGVRLLTMDTGGLDDAATNAYTFWRKCASLGIADRLMLIKGNGSTKAKRLTRSSAQKVDAVPLWVVGTNILKSEVAWDLIRREPGEGKLHLSAELEPWFFDELAAEEQDIMTGQWVKKNPKVRNEAFDLLVYDAAGLIALGGEGLDWEKEALLPEWAQKREPIEQKAVLSTSNGTISEIVTESGINWASLAKSMNG
jgi:phage terminase large subunit GpA-like protein